jgi:hypothetical protein
MQRAGISAEPRFRTPCSQRRGGPSPERRLPHPGLSHHVPRVFPGAAPRLLPNTTHVEFPINTEEGGEELRLWADYYEATARVLEIMRTQGTTTAAVAQIVAEEAKAAGAIKRIKEIRGIKA